MSSFTFDIQEGRKSTVQSSNYPRSASSCTPASVALLWRAGPGSAGHGAPTRTAVGPRAPHALPPGWRGRKSRSSCRSCLPRRLASAVASSARPRARCCPAPQSAASPGQPELSWGGSVPAMETDKHYSQRLPSLPALFTLRPLVL